MGRLVALIAWGLGQAQLTVGLVPLAAAAAAETPRSLVVMGHARSFGQRLWVGLPLVLVRVVAVAADQAQLATVAWQQSLELMAAVAALVATRPLVSMARAVMALKASSSSLMRSQTLVVLWLRQVLRLYLSLERRSSRRCSLPQALVRCLVLDAPQTLGCSLPQALVLLRSLVHHEPLEPSRQLVLGQRLILALHE